MSAFNVEVQHRDEAVHLLLSGELDLSTVTQLEPELELVEQANPKLVILDLRNLKFLDSTGLRLIIEANSRAQEKGLRLAVVRGPDQINRLFDVTGISSKLLLVDNPSDLS